MRHFKRVIDKVSDRQKISELNKQISELLALKLDNVSKYELKLRIDANNQKVREDIARENQALGWSANGNYRVDVVTGRKLC